MQFLKIMFWCLLAFVAALFTYGNWVSITINLWSGTEALVKLPFLLLVAFLVGFLPIYIYHLVTRWRLKQRINATERALSEAQALPITPPSAPMTTGTDTSEPVIDSETLAATTEGRLI